MTSEYWASRVVVRGAADDEHERLQKRFLYGRLEPMHGDVPELEKTPFELEAIGRSVAALRQIMVGLGLEPRSISPKRVHVLTREAYAGRVDSQSIGLATFGHAYVVRDEERQGAFLRHLTHELSHLMSSLTLGVTVGGTARNRELQVRVLRTGMRTMLQGCRNVSFGCTGVCEAATEIVAHRARRLLAAEPDFLDSTTARDICSRWAYYPTVVLLRYVFRQVAESDTSGLGAVEDLLCTDHFAGTHRFMRTVARRQKGLAKVLFRMGMQGSDAVSAAKALGYGDLLEVFAKYSVA